MLEMSKYTNSVTVDNSIVINGVEFMVSDEVAEAIVTMCQTGKLSAPSRYEGNKRTKFAIEKIDGVNGKSFYRICNKMWRGENGNTAYSLGNEAIKALPKILTVELASSKGGTFKAWGYTTEKAAKAALAKLPTEITAEAIEAKRATFKKK